MNLSPNSALFTYLDGSHHCAPSGGDIELNDDTFVYSSSDVMLQSSFEIPIVLSYPNCTIDFQFHSQGGSSDDIEFGVVMALYPDHDNDAALGATTTTSMSTVPDVEFKTLRQMHVYESNRDIPIGGTFHVRDTGVLFFLFSHSKSSSWGETIVDEVSHLIGLGDSSTGNGSDIKSLTYWIKVRTPTFSYVDTTRCEIASKLLHDCMINTADAYDELESRHAYIRENQDGVDELEERLRAMESLLHEKQSEYLTHSKNEENSQKILLQGYDRISGLAIRCLDRRLLTNVISYLYHDKKGENGIGKVSKYWYDIVTNGTSYADKYSYPREVMDEESVAAIMERNRSTAAIRLGPGRSLPPPRHYPTHYEHQQHQTKYVTYQHRSSPNITPVKGSQLAQLSEYARTSPVYGISSNESYTTNNDTTSPTKKQDRRFLGHHTANEISTGQGKSHLDARQIRLLSSIDKYSGKTTAITTSSMSSDVPIETKKNATITAAAKSTTSKQPTKIKSSAGSGTITDRKDGYGLDDFAAMYGMGTPAGISPPNHHIQSSPKGTKSSGSVSPQDTSNATNNIHASKSPQMTSNVEQHDYENAQLYMADIVQVPRTSTVSQTTPRSPIIGSKTSNSDSSSPSSKTVRFKEPMEQYQCDIGSDSNSDKAGEEHDENDTVTWEAVPEQKWEWPVSDGDESPSSKPAKVFVSKSQALHAMNVILDIDRNIDHNINKTTSLLNDWRLHYADNERDGKGPSAKTMLADPIASQYISKIKLLRIKQARNLENMDNMLSVLEMTLEEFIHVHIADDDDDEYEYDSGDGDY